MATEVFSATGNTSTLSGRLMGLIWSGTTSEGDTCVITDLFTGKKIFAGQANSTNTFQGGMFPKSLAVRNGLRITTIASGQVILYFEDH